MEITGGAWMVNPDRARLIDKSAVPKRRLTATVSLHEVFGPSMRLEASAYNIEAREAVAELRASGLPLTTLYGSNGLCQECSTPIRFKRIYVSREKGIPFLSSSDIISLKPTPERFISRKLTKRVDEITVKKWDILISRSGTIGNVALANEYITGMALSEDALRVQASEKGSGLKS